MQRSDGRPLRPGSALPSFSAVSCSLSSPEGRLGACAWALRGFQAGSTPRAPAMGAGHEKEQTMSTQGSDKDRGFIFDPPLRDGEQSPGATMTHEEKLQVA